MSIAGSSTWALELVIAYADEVGLSTAGARMLHHYNNAVVLLPDHNLVVRLTDGPDALRRISRSQAVCRWLVDECGFPATEPARDSPPVVLANAVTASFWQYHHPPNYLVTVTSAELAILLRRLHELPPPPVDLPDWRPLTSLSSILDSDAAANVLSTEEIRWLSRAIAEVRSELADCDWPLGRGLIHGDAWVGNLLPEQRAPQPLIRLGDWDNVSIGPREVDLIPSWHASLRYGRGDAWRKAFERTYGYDLQAWTCYSRLMQMRDLAQLPGPIRRAAHEQKYADALRQRLADIRAGVTDSVWIAL